MQALMAVLESLLKASMHRPSILLPDREKEEEEKKKHKKLVNFYSLGTSHFHLFSLGNTLLDSVVTLGEKKQDLTENISPINLMDADKNDVTF